MHTSTRAEAPTPMRRERVRRAATSPATIAILVWLVATPVAIILPRATGFDPFTERGAFVPLAAGGVLLAVVTAVGWWRWAGEWVAAGAAGLFAAWVALALQVALNGTPFGFSGLVGDMGRMSATVTRYTVTPWPTDTFVEGLTSEYPPLYPWLIGRGALLTDVPAWRLLGLAEIVVTSLAVLAAFLLWRRLVPAWVALAVTGVCLLHYGDPRKAFGVITLFVFIPWLISAFTEGPRGRMHWLPAGVIGGLIMLSYIGWFPFGALGVLAVVVASWRRTADRAGYVRHVLLVGAVAAIVASPYLVPWGYAALTQGGQAVSDLYVSSEITTNGFPFLQPTLLGALQLIGLAGLVWYRNRTWWAWPLLYLVIGSYVFWLVMGIRFVLTQHTTLLHYVPTLTGTVLAAAGVLTLTAAGPALVRRLTVTPPYRTGAAALAVAMLWVGFSYWQDWRPHPTLGVSAHNDYATMAHLEPRPDCSYPRYAPAQGRFGCVPADRIKAEVERVRGVGDRPYTLSSDERLFAFLPWRGYMGTDRTSASTLTRWDDRHAELTRLAQLSDPAEFARASANTQFGPIDVFVLGRGDADTWQVIDVSFRRAQFDPAVWTIVDNLPEPVVLAIRRSA